MIEQKIEKRVNEFIAAMEKSREDGSFVKLSLGNYKGENQALKKLLIKPVLIKNERQWNITYRYKTRDETKNVASENYGDVIRSFVKDGFQIMTLFTTQFDLIYENIHNKKIVLRKTAPSHVEPLSLAHDHNKIRAIPPDTRYLRELGISDKHGKVFKATQDKYRQLNHYIHMLESVLDQYTPGKEIHVYDMGSGKGYLTFALYDYMRNKRKLNVHVTGVEIRQELVNKCNDVAHKSSYENLNFEVGTIESHSIQKLTMLVALHACDTATDDAIFKGIQGGAEIIVVAPCCHKQIRQEIHSTKPENDLDFLLKYGVFMERQAEMVTDGIRSMVLEYYGYKVKVAEFISDAHTAKNVMIIATKSNRVTKSEEVLDKIKTSMKYFGIKKHHLVELLDVENGDLEA